MTTYTNVLALNTGSSSLKFACYKFSESSITLLYKGSTTHIGYGLHGCFSVEDDKRACLVKVIAKFEDIDSACFELFKWIRDQIESWQPNIVGHRIVHGGPKYFTPQLLTSEVISALEDISIYASEHIPQAIKAIAYATSNFPSLPQVACFDTGFHHSIPDIAKVIAIPEPFRKHGLQKYGFHGLSYEYLMNELHKEDNAKANSDRIILAHLGNGSSMAAVQNGQCIDTTMGFSPCGGFPMVSRSGDLDPEVILFLIEHEHVPIDSLKDLFNRKSGVLALVDSCSNFQDLLLSESNGNEKSRFAITYFCYHVRKHLCALVGAMNGLDTLVFSAGIGENSPTIRSRICAGLETFGIIIDDEKNANNESIISSPFSRVSIRVIPTNEEVIVAKQCMPWK